MIKRYSYIEPLFNLDKDIDKGLSVEVNEKSVLRIFRALSGTCKVVDDFDGKEVRFDVNYFTMPFSKNSRYRKGLVSDVFSDEVRLSHVSRFFKLLTSNDDFYDVIEPEVLNCLIARKKERYLEAFIFLYRILEGVSYSIPLIYVSKSRSYRKTFNELKKYVGGADKELAFFSKFVTSVFKEENFYQLTMDVKMSDIDIEELRGDFYKIYKSKLKGEYIDSDIEDEEISITFIGYFHFLIEIRNRYFHFLSGTWQDNIETRRVVYPDLFFKPIVDLGINWMSIILFEIIKFDIEKDRTI